MIFHNTSGILFDEFLIFKFELFFRKSVSIQSSMDNNIVNVQYTINILIMQSIGYHAIIC